MMGIYVKCNHVFKYIGKWQRVYYETVTMS